MSLISKIKSENLGYCFSTFVILMNDFVRILIYVFGCKTFVVGVNILSIMINGNDTFKKLILWVQ